MPAYIGRGSGVDGDLSVVGTVTEIPLVFTTLTATAGTKIATVPAGLGFVAGQAVYAHQTQGTGHGRTDFNIVRSYVGTTLTCEYPFTYDYSTSGANVAQIQTIKQYSSITFAASAILTCTAWNGTNFGLLPILCTGQISGPGTISVKGKGFRGGGPSTSVNGGNALVAYQGESYLGLGIRSTSANAHSGGGGGTPGDAGPAGGGGSNRTLGDGGQTDGGTPGQAGVTASSSDASLMDFGGSGGGGRGESNANTAPSGSFRGGQGGNSGGIIDICAALIAANVTIDILGEIGQAASGFSDAGCGGGGTGAAGCCRTQCGQDLAGTNMNGTFQLGGLGSGPVANRGGKSGVGLFVRKACQVQGVSTPAAETQTNGGLAWCSSGGFIY